MRNGETPVILMGYLNSILAMGEGAFAERAASAGVDGLIVVNLPPEESQPLREALAKGRHRSHSAGGADHFGRTLEPHRPSGQRLHLPSVPERHHRGRPPRRRRRVERHLGRLRQRTRLPVLVGFGIKDGETARAVAQHADGVVIGAALVSRMGALRTEPEAIPAALRRVVRDIRRAMDR